MHLFLSSYGLHRSQEEKIKAIQQGLASTDTPSVSLLFPFLAACEAQLPGAALPEQIVPVWVPRTHVSLPLAVTREDPLEVTVRVLGALK